MARGQPDLVSRSRSSDEQMLNFVWLGIHQDPEHVGTINLVIAVSPDLDNAAPLSVMSKAQRTSIGPSGMGKSATPAAGQW